MLRPVDRKILAALAGLAAVFAAIHALPLSGETRSKLYPAAALVLVAVAGAVILWSGRRPNAWAGARPLGAAVLLGAAFPLYFLIHAIRDGAPRPMGGSVLPAIGALAVGFLVASPLWVEVRDHFRAGDRREVLADMSLLTASLGTLVFVLLLPASAVAPTTVVSSAAFALSVVPLLVGYGAVAAWLPSPAHVGIFAIAADLLGAVTLFGYRWIRHDFVPGRSPVDLALGLGLVAFAALLVAEPRLVPERPEVADARFGRPALTVIAVTTAFAALAVVAAMDLRHDATDLEMFFLIAVVGAAVSARILVNQVRGVRDRERTERALSEKEDTLRETDAALVRLREVHASLAASEARLRLLFDAAVDGIVELDAQGVIRRANEAFCSMIGRNQAEVVGKTWEALATEVGDGSPLLALSETGQAKLIRGEGDVHLEARSSELPGPEPGRLLLVRDVSAAKVADQTIRSLFKFLQDRDEDRTRLLKRTNAAIEAERNRIARDLHDGPVQGVSAASLSLEAVLLMLRSGDLEAGIQMLTRIRLELAEETDNLRRLMGDLRPPVLEERGLAPALRETLNRFGRENNVRTRFESRSYVEVPTDIETLAYRVVQEALSNASKHARATEVAVSVEAEAGQLRVEVADNGQGFDTARVRDFLRTGRVGLASMRERTELANGTLMVRSAEGGGTTVTATFPFDIVPARRTSIVERTV